MSNDKWLLIRNYNLWSHLSDEEYEELNIVHNFIEADKGDYIYFEAFNHQKLYFIKEGYIRIGYIDNEGKEVIKEIIQKGEIFGQVTVERGNLQGEFAQAHKAPVSLCAFTVDDFERLLKKRPELALKYSRQVGSKLKNIENRLVNLLHKDVKTRLINFFAHLFQHADADQHKESLCLPNFLTHEDIAHLVGSSRQTVTTLINELSEEGLISFNRQQICITDVKKLQKLVTVG